VISFLRAYKRIIVFSLVLAFCAYRLIYPGEFGRVFGLLLRVTESARSLSSAFVHQALLLRLIHSN
jgi:hypothetical protein